MVLLAFDTSTRRVTVAVARDADRVCELTLDAAGPTGAPRHAEVLVPALDYLCRMVGVSPRDATAIAVGIGPGTFTGLRVGIVTAKTLASARDVPVVAVSSLELLAASARVARPGVEWVVPVLDARRAEVYWGIHEAAPGYRTLQAARVGAPEAIAPSLAAIGGDPARALVVGDGAARFADQLAGFACPTVVDHAPRGAVLAELAFARLAAGDVLAASSIQPCYLRASDAEIAAGGAV